MLQERCVLPGLPALEQLWLQPEGSLSDCGRSPRSVTLSKHGIDRWMDDCNNWVSNDLNRRVVIPVSLGVFVYSVDHQITSDPQVDQTLDLLIMVPGTILPAESEHGDAERRFQARRSLLLSNNLKLVKSLIKVNCCTRRRRAPCPADIPVARDGSMPWNTIRTRTASALQYSVRYFLYGAGVKAQAGVFDLQLTCAGICRVDPTVMHDPPYCLAIYTSTPVI